MTVSHINRSKSKKLSTDKYKKFSTDRSKNIITEWKSLEEQIGLCYDPSDEIFSYVKPLHETVLAII